MRRTKYTFWVNDASDAAAAQQIVECEDKVITFGMRIAAAQISVCLPFMRRREHNRAQMQTYARIWHYYIENYSQTYTTMFAR